MFRGFSFRLAPTPFQRELFVQFAGGCRLVWNLALEQRTHHWRNFQARTGNNLNYVMQARELTALRAEFDFIKAVPQASQQFALKALDDAFRKFFKGTAGFPSRKKRGQHEAFTVPGRDIEVRRISARWGEVRLPKIGWVRFRMSRELFGTFTQATVSLTPLGWHVSIGCKSDAETPDVGGVVGIDRGVTVPLMLSDGTSYSLPKRIAALDRKARKAQRVVARRKRGSVRHRKAMRRVADIRAKEARVRKHWAHTSTTDICRRYGTVVIERLRTKDMTASAAGTLEVPGRNVAQKRGLNRAILNVGWHRIETMLFYKAFAVKKVDPKYTSQTCSQCGNVDSRSRESQARFVCTACGFRDNADRNAAINIRNRGNTPGVETTFVVDEARTVQGLSFLGNPPPSGGGRC